MRIHDTMVDGSKGELFTKLFEINEMLKKYRKNYIFHNWLYAIVLISICIATFLLNFLFIMLLIFITTVITLIIRLNNYYKIDYSILLFSKYLDESIEERINIHFYTIFLKQERLDKLIKKKLGKSYLLPDDLL